MEYVVEVPINYAHEITFMTIQQPKEQGGNLRMTIGYYFNPSKIFPFPEEAAKGKT